MKRTFHLLFSTVVLMALNARGAEPLKRHLFLDPSFLEKTQGAALHVNPPERRELVIRPDKPWEQLMISFFLTVRDEDGKLRMWYICRDKKNQPNVAYAESTDGVNWVKPELGIVDYEGSTKNNLVGMSSLEGVVFQDPKAPPAERYAYVTHLITEGMVRFFSPDGLHWNRDAVPLMKFGADTQNVTFWDEQRQAYVMYLRGWHKADDKKKYRRVVRAEMPSLTSPVPVEPTEKSARPWGKDKTAVIDDEYPTVFAADGQDAPNSDVYNLSAQPYPLDPQWYVGFPSMFQREKGTSDGRLEIQFAGSHDGIAWNRYDRRPYVRPGLAGSDNASMVFMGTGMVVRGDEIWQYGTGLQSRHGDKEARVVRTDGVIYRYVQRVDGFVSLDFDAAGGDCVTGTVKVDGGKLIVNVDTGALGSLRMGLLDEEGKALPGFGVEECDAMRTNATQAVVSWHGANDLSAMNGRSVKVALAGARSKVFSFYFQP